MMLRFATYDAWVDAVESFMTRRGLSDGERHALLADNARRANPRMQVPMHHVH